MVRLVYALFIAIAAYGITNALFGATWLNILVALVALFIFLLVTAGQYLLSFFIIGLASLFGGEGKSLKQISDEALGDVLDDDMFDGDDDDD